MKYIGYKFLLNKKGNGVIILKKLLLKNSKKFIALIIGLFLFPLVAKADHIYGGTVVVEWVDA